ncbi:hypothetical protein [Nocardia sp. NPDC052566]|uniref:hypothetical protein n=1 Tax=Nocardia sp. NPDC052566 TaxID=3364330 RepID=UPI0037C61C20
MASDGPGDGGSDYSGGPSSEVPDAPRGPSRHGDPSVENVWLGRRPPPPPRRHRGPRPSTALLLIAFITALVCYLMLRPGG